MADVSLFTDDDASPSDEPRINIALPWYEGGCSVIPIKAGGGKGPWLKEWRSYQVTPPTSEDVRNWWGRLYPHSGVAVICGAVSGNLEMLELEGRASSPEHIAKILDSCSEYGVLDLWRFLNSDEGYGEQSPSGGLHFLYRVQSGHSVPGNKKLARRVAEFSELSDDEKGLALKNPSFRAIRVLAETRGEGGYVIVAPTPDYCHKLFKPWVTLNGVQGRIPSISWEERNRLHDAISAALDEMPESTPPPVVATATVPRLAGAPGEPRPGDIWAETAQWTDEWFTGQGWKVHHKDHDGTTYWTRPGKDIEDGFSATTGRALDADRLWVWSTGTTLPTESPLSKFWVYAHYHFNGNLSETAKHLNKIVGGQTPATSLSPWASSSAMAVDPKDRIPASGTLDLTDTGYGLELLRRSSDKFRYSTDQQSWFIWDHTAWIRDNYLHIERAAQAIAADMLAAAKEYLGQNSDDKAAKEQVRLATLGLNQARLTAAISRFKAQKGITITAADWDNQSHLLNLGNGTYNLITHELREARPDDQCTLLFGADYDIEATCPQFLTFMEDVLPDEATRQYVQKALGYSLLGKPVERAMFLLHGPSGTGKSVLTDVMTQVFGDYGITAPGNTFRLQQGDGTHELHQLRGRRYVATSELPQGAQLNEDLVKRLTGGDRVSSRDLYEKHQNWYPKCAIWIATNFLPKVNSDDDAIWNRAKTIPMRTVFGQNGKALIKGYADVLVRERNGILNWLLEGLRRYQADGLDEPSAVIADVAAYRVDTDPVACWLRDSLDEGTFIEDAEAMLPLRSIYMSYLQHCTDSGDRALSLRRFSQRIISLGQRLENVKHGGQKHIRGLRAHTGVL